MEVSSRKSTEKRKITELLDKVTIQNTIIVSELSRLGRSIKEVLQIIEELIQVKGCKLYNTTIYSYVNFIVLMKR